MDDDAMSKLGAVDWDDAAPRLLAFARRWSPVSTTGAKALRCPTG